MRIYYVDCENRNVKNWASNIHKLMPSDEVILFWTDNAQKLSLSYIDNIVGAKCKIKTTYVQTGTPNALDFVLIMHLSQRVLTARKSKHIIISQDTGYNVVVKLLSNKGYNVYREDVIRP